MDQLQRILAELRHLAGPCTHSSFHLALSSFPSISDLFTTSSFSSWVTCRLPLLRHDAQFMTSLDPESWRRLGKAAGAQLLHLIWVFLVYLLSELIIWGLSRALAPLSLQFFSSIISMLLVFVCIVVADMAWPPVESIYQRWLKPRVDFINTHMGIGFPVPIVMLNENDILDGRDIACILGNAVISNILSWIFVFCLAYFSWSAYLRISGVVSNDSDFRGLPMPITAKPPRIDVTWHPGIDSGQIVDGIGLHSSDAATPNPSTTAPGRASIDRRGTGSYQAPENEVETDHRTCGNTGWPIVLAFVCVLLIGAPVTASTEDNRLLDASVLWLVWISAVITQRVFRRSGIFRHLPRFKSVISTMMNPVLITTLTMIGYTRIRAMATRGDLKRILDQFSAGSPLYALWTAEVRGVTLAENPRSWFGAGDVALSLLECGIFIWGFKVFECRRQLFSAAGALTILVAVVAAIGNVFLPVLTGKAIGLSKPEALSFSARSVTLTLAKPAIEAVGGNMAVNAALVVGNGIFGQLMYPFTLDLLKTDTGDIPPMIPSNRSKPVDVAREKSSKAQCNHAWIGSDNPSTVAAGIAVGINGAAMGVAYLYETRSRAAPYAALSMTVFGVVTVVLTTVGPFKTLVIGLAGG